jgi:NADPH:quinone reductase
MATKPRRPRTARRARRPGRRAASRCAWECRLRPKRRIMARGSGCGRSCPCAGSWVARGLPVGEPRNRVVQVRRFGDPDELEVVDAPLPPGGRGEVRVRVLASGVEYTHALIRRHLYPQTMLRRPPFVLGYDLVGEIDQLGDGGRGFQVGDRVADLTVVGSNAAYRTLRAHRPARVPRGRGRGAPRAWPPTPRGCQVSPHRSASGQRSSLVIFEP